MPIGSEGFHIGGFMKSTKQTCKYAEKADRNPKRMEVLRR